MTAADAGRRKLGRSKATRRGAQPDCCAAAAASRRVRKLRPAVSDPSPPVKPLHRIDPYRPCSRLPAGARSASMPPALTMYAGTDESCANEPRRRCVSFDLKASSQHEITPYAEIYGIHPSQFLFERHEFVLLLDDNELGCYAPDRGEKEDEDDDDEDEAEDENEENVQKDASEENWVVVHSI